jgi:hypothetical protein
MRKVLILSNYSKVMTKVKVYKSKPNSHKFGYQRKNLITRNTHVKKKNPRSYSQGYSFS